MRLWSLHPKYLDRKGLGAAWLEAIIAQNVLRGATRGYRNHPQLERFKRQPEPESAIAAFLTILCQEGRRRGYRFNERYILGPPAGRRIPVTKGQLSYEWALLKHKLKARDPQKYEQLLEVSEPEAHPLFEVVPGEIESWERPKEL
jgi:hypothetical protein